MATETYDGTRNQTFFSRISDQINFPEQIVDQAKMLWENWRFPGNKYKWTETQRQAQNKGKQTPFLSKCILNTFASILVPRFLDKLEDIQSKPKNLRSPTNICTQSKSLKYHFQEKPHQCFVMWFLPLARMTTPKH